MKRLSYIRVFGGLALLCLLAAGCGEEPMTSDVVFGKTIEASKSLQSFNLMMDMTQSMEEAGNKMDMTFKMNSDAILTPLSMHQKMTTSFQGQNMVFEMYLADQGIFMYDDAAKQWLRMPSNQVEQLKNTISVMQTDPGKQLELLRKYAGQFTLTEEAERYALKMTASGEGMKELMEDIMKNSFAGAGALPKEVLDTMKITKTGYTFTVDKKTFLPQNIIVDTDMTMEIEKGKPVHIVQHMNGTYSKFDSIPAIKVPEEALEKAKEAVVGE